MSTESQHSRFSQEGKSVWRSYDDADMTENQKYPHLVPGVKRYQGRRFLSSLQRIDATGTHRMLMVYLFVISVQQ